MKLCPYPFSRMQTKNEQADGKGGFFPCCPSWFTKSYWDIGLEKNLDDIWNGKAAIELRKRMYEGDYSLCNRNECKMPLMSIEELSSPDINFIETPISKENLEAIKQKNPIMPKQPSSLHLVADLRCNLKCPTCRPEIISNTKESIEAEEEFELVHRFKNDVEIIKMSSGGEVFYSQTQRKLLKSFNKEDFPKLRRVHIVSNGTFFNQKTYNDLSPGTSYIKDISISLDAGSKEVYEKLRGPYWEQVISNLEWLGQMRKAGKFEFLTLNCTLIRDNYRDVPNLVALGKKYNVDRILIQKYISGQNQGYKTLQEQNDQAIHDPEHPEHIHMLRTLEMFKDEPLVHTLLGVEGYEQKIEDSVKTKKFLSETKKLISAMENGEFVNALIFINEMFGIHSLTDNYLEKMEKNFRDGIIDLPNIPSLAGDKTSSFKSRELQTIVLVHLMNCFYNFQKKDRHLEAINTFVLLAHFNKGLSAHMFGAVSNSLKELSRLEEAMDFSQKAISLDKESLSNLDMDDKNFDLYSLNIQLGFLHHGQSNPEWAAYYLSEAKKIELSGKVEKQFSKTHYFYNRDLGFFYQENQKYKLAAEAFNKALELGEGDADLYFAMGISLKRQMKYAEAKKYFIKALRERPSHYYAIMEFGVIELLEGERKVALELFLKAKRLEPEGRKSFGDTMIKLASRKKVFGIES